MNPITPTQTLNLKTQSNNKSTLMAKQKKQHKRENNMNHPTTRITRSKPTQQKTYTNQSTNIQLTNMQAHNTHNMSNPINNAETRKPTHTQIKDNPKQTTSSNPT